MTILQPELMRTLAKLAEEGSFTRAGERLGLTQQAVSVHVRKIEKSINRQVVSRRGARVKLTDDGEALLAYARQVFDIDRRVQHHFAAVQLSGRVRIGLTEGFVVDGLPLLLTSLRDRQPDLEVIVECGHTERLLARQENGNLDMVLGIQRSGGARGEKLWVDRPRWVGDVSLLARGGVVRLATLPGPSLMRTLAIEALTRAGMPYQIVFESESRSSIRVAALSGLGVALFCKTLDTDIDFEGADGGLPKVDPVEFFIRLADGTDATAAKVAGLLRDAVGTLHAAPGSAPGDGAGDA